jgi:deazaflavin-dependent oxidoreductase (nitroreductase family)
MAYPLITAPCLAACQVPAPDRQARAEDYPGPDDADRGTGGIPVLTIATTGTRSGRRRTAPLDGSPFADGIAIIGAYFGQLGTPGWYYNLRARLKWYITRWDLEEPAAAQDYLAEALSCSELERTS